MKILYICHRWPFPPKRGGKIRPFNMISHLNKDHEVTVASIVRSSAEGREGVGLSNHCHDTVSGQVGRVAAAARMLLRVPTPIPSSMGYFYSPDIKIAIQKLLAEHRYELIFVHCSSVAQYVARTTGIPKILDFGDMDSQKWLAYSTFKPFPLSLGYQLEGKKLQAAEIQLANQFDMCTCTTELELETLRSFGADTQTDWFPNGVDYDYFSPGSDYDPLLISFIGRMDYYPNQQCMVEFCTETLPLIQQKLPQAKLTIVGAEPPARIRRLAERTGVEVTGSVPDVRPYVQRSAVNVAPLSIARGTQNKILEAMAMGVPVVASEVAGRGIDAVSPVHFLEASTPGTTAAAVLSVLENPERRQQLAQAGRERVTEHHAWPRSLQRLDEIIETTMSRGPRQ